MRVTALQNCRCGMCGGTSRSSQLQAGILRTTSACNDPTDALRAPRMSLLAFRAAANACAHKQFATNALAKGWPLKMTPHCTVPRLRLSGRPPRPAGARVSTPPTRAAPSIASRACPAWALPNAIASTAPFRAGPLMRPRKSVLPRLSRHGFINFSTAGMELRAHSMAASAAMKGGSPPSASFPSAIAQSTAAAIMDDMYSRMSE